MIFWHTGATIFLFRWIFRDPKVDLRFLVLGALLPDLVDKPVGLILFADAFGTGRIFGHTMVFAAITMTIAMVATGRSTLARRRAVTLAVGIFFHLLLDGMWTIPETLFWPSFGFEFPPGPADYWSGFLGRILASPLTIAQEVVGLAYLGYLGTVGRLSDPAARRRLYREGHIVAEVPSE